MVVSGWTQVGNGSVAGRNLPDVVVILPVLTQHHAPVGVLERGMKWKSVIYHI